MKSVVEEITKLRRGLLTPFEQEISGRYRLTVQEKDKTQTAYFFSCPIRNLNRKPVELRFDNSEDRSIFRGSNCEISISDKIMFRNSNGSCQVSFPLGITKRTNTSISYEHMTVFPTFNGLAFKVDSGALENIDFTLSLKSNCDDLRMNSKYIAFMTQWLEPLITVLCTGTLGKNGEVSGDAELICRKTSSKTISIKMRAKHSEAKYVMFEINMYEPKLLQDTTVESKKPDENNVFGNTAFIGTSNCCGEQWLFSRMDFSKIVDLVPHEINSAKLHLPKLNDSNLMISAYKVKKRFCSFGSNWKNKVGVGDFVSRSYNNGDYISLDITGFLINNESKKLIYTDGLLLKCDDAQNQFVVVPTADSCYSPQIVEINYR